MIRINKYLYINPLLAAFAAVCYMTGKTEYFIISYASMIVHECFHFAAALFIGLKPANISLHPFGVNLRLKNTLVYTLADEIILYLSGPLSNIILAVIFAAALKSFPFSGYVAAVNTALFFVNILPVCPLDGGNICKKILIYNLGEQAASSVMKIISAIIAVAIFAAGVYMSAATGFNYSVVLISVLIFANIFTQREKYSQDTVRNLVFAGKKKHGDMKMVRLYVSGKSFEPIKAAKYFRPSKYTCVAVVGEDGSIRRVFTQDELTDILLGTNTS